MRKKFGASPQVDLDSIVAIKCPFAARNTNIKTAIEKKKIKYLEIDNMYIIKRKRPHYKVVDYLDVNVLVSLFSQCC
jgi:hypothetical protein